MKLNEYAKKWNITKDRAKLMAPYIGGYKCPCCNQWNIPDDAQAIYIPDKRKYKKECKKYCYLIDAITQNMKLDEDLSSITNIECRTIVRELRSKNAIVLKDGCNQDSLDYCDYMVSADYLNWKQTKDSEKSELILSTIIKCAEAATAIANMAYQVIA